MYQLILFLQWLMRQFFFCMKGTEKVNNIPLTHLVGGRAGAEPGCGAQYKC